MEQSQPIVARRSTALRGSIKIPGDKSMSHRALILGSLAVGRTSVSGLLVGDDVLRTAAAVATLGAQVMRHEDCWTIDGVGVGGLQEPEQVLDLGNSGTGARLLLGAVATHPITAVFTGDASLARRPMGRVTKPLAEFGAQFFGRAGNLLPMSVIGATMPISIEYRVPVPSAQVKSAILLAGLNAPGRTIVTEPVATRDHTERMLRHFGANVSSEPAEGGGVVIAIDGQPELVPARIEIPGDISSAAFPLVAGLITEGSDILIRDVGLNPLRTGLLDSLREMGAAIEIQDPRIVGDEPVGDLRVRSGALRGVTIPAERAASMIDEYPILAMAAAVASGRTVLLGLEELKVKESDRLTAIARGLAACGVAVAADGGTLTIEGCGGPPPGGGRIETALDHRIAMAFLVLGLATKAPVEIDDGATIATSFPGFVELMQSLGAQLGPPE
jgi:3-phosphoshikimate 1-carboxyvinyltransferase